MSDTSATHYVAPIPEGTVAVDAIKIADKPSNLWRDAWADIRKRPMFWISLAIVPPFFKGLNLSFDSFWISLLRKKLVKKLSC